MSRLYNGIEFMSSWISQDMTCVKEYKPMEVPYLENKPRIIPIDVGRQLFVDDFLIESTTLKRIFHMPEKYEENPVLKPETKLEINSPFNAAAVPKGGGVWWNPLKQVYEMWYEAGWIGTISYATSKDGLKWERPELDVNPGTNQVLPNGLKPDSGSVVLDFETSDVSQRYKMFMRGPAMYPDSKMVDQCVCLTSPDGIHWGNCTESGDCGDRSTMFYNPFRKKWVFSLRAYDGDGLGRSRRYWDTDDFLDCKGWKNREPCIWTSADRLDILGADMEEVKPSLYNLDAVAYESLMLGMFEINRGPENHVWEKTGLPKITELSFAYSRDGFHWHRPDRRAHIPAMRTDVWDRGYVQSISNICTIHGDKLFIYYTAFQGNAKKKGGYWLSNGMYDRGATGVAFLRRDGFASMKANETQGVLTTRPLTFTGTTMFVNADTPDGSLFVEILDEDGQIIAPFTSENCKKISSDSTLEPVVWSCGTNLSSLQGKVVRFRFYLCNGSLYSFWVSQDETGRSDGYVAGGGPGYTSNKDTVGRAAYCL